jgi:hypothetical protein
MSKTNTGWVYLHKSILEWEWYGDQNVFRLFVHLLLKANYTTTKWKGIKIKRGQHLTGRFSLSKETGLTEQQVRTALNKLISTNEITKETTSQYTVITITNYDKYQPSNQQPNQRITNEQPTDNHSLNKRNKRNKKSISKDIRKPVQRGSSDINECVDFLKQKIGASLDGTVKENRQYCYNLLRKMKKDYPETDPVENIKLLIETAIKDKFHSKNATGFKYLYYNTQKISVSFKRNKFNSVAVIS